MAVVQKEVREGMRPWPHNDIDILKDELAEVLKAGMDVDLTVTFKLGGPNDEFLARLCELVDTERKPMGWPTIAVTMEITQPSRR